MTPEQTNELFRSLGSIEQQLLTLTREVKRIDSLERRIVPLEKAAWKVGALLAGAAVVFEVTVRFFV